MSLQNLFVNERIETYLECQVDVVNNGANSSKKIKLACGNLFKHLRLLDFQRSLGDTFQKCNQWYKK